MATIPFPGPWSPNTLFTGNGVYVLDAAANVWLIANSTTSGATLYRSDVGGTVFEAIVTIPNVGSSTLAFDPAMAIDTSGALHIIGQVEVGSTVALRKYTYTPSTTTLSGPFLVTTGGYIGSDYDIVALSNGNCYIATALLTDTTESALGIELSPTGAIVNTDTLLTQGIEVGQRYGSVSLWSQDNVAVEIYLCFEAKAMHFDDTTAYLSRTIRSGPNEVSAPTILTSFTARFVADRLTVIGVGPSRYISQCFYTQTRGALIGNVVIGREVLPNQWSFNTFTGTPASSFVEPTLSIMANGAYALTVFNSQLAVADSFGSGVGEHVVLLDQGVSPANASYTVTAPGGTLTLVAGGTGGTAYVALREADNNSIYHLLVIGAVAYLQPYIVSSMNLRDTVTSDIWTLEVYGAKFHKYKNPTALSSTVRTVYLNDLSDPSNIVTWELAMVNGVLDKIQASSVAAQAEVVFMDAFQNNKPYRIFIDSNKMKIEPSTLTLPSNVPTFINLTDGTSGSMILAVIEANLSNFTQGGPVRLFDVNPLGWSLTPRTDFPYPAIATWLRGSKSTLPLLMPWGFLAESSPIGVARFYTGYNAPPTAVVNPSSVIATRGVTYQFDASLSSDINLDHMVFDWQITDLTGLATLVKNGSTATVSLPASSGPVAHTITVTVLVSDVDAQGVQIHSSPSTASAFMSYPFVPAPVIGALNPISATRNSTVLIAPVVTLGAMDFATYSWAQTGGTPVTLPSGSTGPSLRIQTNGALVSGESLSFTLTVNDGVNAAVTQSFTVVVAARAASGETMELTRFTWAGGIAQRNSAHAWGAGVAAGKVTQFSSAKRAVTVFAPDPTATMTTVGFSYIMIGATSVLVQRGGHAYHVYLPDVNDTILDAVHAYADHTIVLTASAKVMRFVPSATFTDLDGPVGSVDLSEISTSGFTSIQATPPFGGARVLSLSGPGGVLLLHVDDDFNVLGDLLLSTGPNGHLYGASKVMWVRVAGIEDLHSGTILVGTSDTLGNTFETEIVLSTRTVIGAWSKSQLKSQTATTGEILFGKDDTYSGIPMPPVLAAPVAQSSGYLLAWTSSRPDLVTQYVISMAIGGGPFLTYRTIGSGAILSTVVQLTAGATYRFRVTANSMDGSSVPSNTVQISI